MMEAIEKHRTWLDSSGEGDRRRKQRVGAYVKEIVQETMARHLWQENNLMGQLDRMLDDIMEGLTDPFSVAEEIMHAGGTPVSSEGDEV